MKVLHQRHFTQRTLLPYEREVDVMKRLSHDHIVQFIAVEQEVSLFLSNLEEYPVVCAHSCSECVNLTALAQFVHIL